MGWRMADNCFMKLLDFSLLFPIFLLFFSVDFSPADHLFSRILFYLFDRLTFLCGVDLFIYIFHKMLKNILLWICGCVSEVLILLLLLFYVNTILTRMPWWISYTLFHELTFYYLDIKCAIFFLILLWFVIEHFMELAP